MAFLKNLVRLTSSWVGCPAVPVRERLRYPLRTVMVTALRRSEILYLGQPFCFDNFKIPVLLLGYPDDVTRCLIPYLSEPIETVLDIGGNVGQFSRTFCHYMPGIQQLDVFEANGNLTELLERNLPDMARVFPYGVGPPGQQDFYLVDGASVGSSLSAERATDKGREPIKTTVEFISDIASLTGRSDYDLVKVDVEGAECLVLQHLQVRPRYMWLELSGCEKPGVTHKTSEVYHILRENFGSFDVLYQSEWQASRVCDVLLRFEAVSD